MSFDKPWLRIYVSGAISGLDVETYTANFARGCDLLARRKHIPVNPLLVEPCADKSCDGRTPGGQSAEGGFVHDWSCYMKHDIKAMMECDGILLIPGWRDSRGANIEYHLAHDLGMQVRHTPDYETIEELGI